ncbi:MAG: extracellular solute-binding protein [Anaerolineae bacterium]
MLALLVICLTASSVMSQASAPIQITILSNFTPDVSRGKIFNEIIDTFNQEYAGEIEVISNPDPDWPTLQQKIRSLIAAGTPADVFLYNYNGNDLSREESGLLMDWTPYLDADPEWKARFHPENLEALTVNGEIVGIPSDQAPVLFYYHKDLFEQAGIDTFPTTWDEFFADADALKASGVAPIALMTSDDAWHAMNAFTYLAAGLGGKDVFAVGQSLDTPAVMDAADQLKRMFEYTTSDAVGANYSVSSANFLNKNAAMIIDGPWLISSIQGQVEDPCNVGVAVAPTFGDDTIPAGFVVTDSLNPWGAAKQSDPAREEAVVEWMKFLTSEDNVKKISVEGEYPMAISTTFTEDDLAQANCQMAQVLQLSNAASVTVVEAVRNIKPSAQAQLPSLLEGLALDQLSPADFTNQLQQYNQ